MRYALRAALVFSLAGLSACGTAKLAPVVYHHQGGRLQSDIADAGAGASDASAGYSAGVGDGITPVQGARVERQSLDVTSSSLPPPSGASSDELPPPHSSAEPAPSAPLVVAEPPPAARSSVAPREVVVRNGDTVYSIARAHGISRTALIAENGLEAPFGLNIGQRLKLPRERIASHVRSGASEGGPLLKMGQMPEPPASASSPVSLPDKDEIIVAKPSVHGFVWPVKGKVVSDFGYVSGGRKNDGIDIAVPEGTPVRAAREGEVIYAGNELKGYGNLILIRHDGDFVSAYAHNSKLVVKRGQMVRQGQHIADAGASGSVKSSRVHFEIRKDRKPVDPQGYLPRG